VVRSIVTVRLSGTVVEIWHLKDNGVTKGKEKVETEEEKEWKIKGRGRKKGKGEK